MNHKEKVVIAIKKFHQAELRLKDIRVEFKETERELAAAEATLVTQLNSQFKNNKVMFAERMYSAQGGELCVTQVDFATLEEKTNAKGEKTVV